MPDADGLNGAGDGDGGATHPPGVASPESPAPLASPPAESKPEGVRYSYPKPLRGKARLEIHTRPAQAVFFGRKKQIVTKENGEEVVRHEIHGVISFARNIRRVTDGAISDDPYADLKLLEIEDAFRDAEAVLHKQTEKAVALLQGKDFIDIEIALSQQPVVHELTFRSPYSHWASRLVSQFDTMAMAILSARHFGILEKGSVEKELGLAKQLLRGRFILPSTYKFSGAKRDDIINETKRGRLTLKNFGAVPEDVLMRERLPDFGPNVARTSDEDDLPSAATLPSEL